MKISNTKNVIFILLSDYYNENVKFLADFSTIAYVFVFSIVPDHVGIRLFPSITPLLNAKKAYQTHTLFS
jgi:hypothetical protein